MGTFRQRLWIILWGLSLVLFLYPINNLPLRLGLIALLLSACISLIYFFRSRKAILYSLIATIFVIIGFIILPGRNAESNQLRDAYLHSLRSYEGTHYIWGGENRLGIDCSGLVRAGLIKANFLEGLKTLNPKLVRFSLSLWWHDCSAQALGEQYRGLTKRILSCKSINAVNETQIQPGDIAVTANGVHVLAYLGNDKWIEADPHYGKVIIVHVPTAKNPWFNEPVHIMRWTELEAQ